MTRNAGVCNVFNLLVPAKAIYKQPDALRTTFSIGRKFLSTLTPNRYLTKGNFTFTLLLTKKGESSDCILNIDYGNANQSTYAG